MAVCHRIFSIATFTCFLSSPIALAQSQPFMLEDFDFWAEQCRSLDQARQDAEALTACEQAITLKPNDDNLNLWMARSDILLRSNRYAESIASYDRVLRVTPNSSIALARRCNALFHLQRFDDAIDTCEQALRIDGDWGTQSPSIAWYYRGLAFAANGRQQTAIASFDRALQLDPADALAIAGYCGTLAQITPLRAQVDRCRPAASSDENPIVNLPACESNQTIACNLRSAIAASAQILARDPNNADLWMQQGFAFEQLGDFAGAQTAYDRAVQLAGQSSIALARRCGVLNQQMNYQAAIESCTAAFQADQRWNTQAIAHAWTQMGIALAGLGQLDAALAAIDRALALNPADAAAWNSRAVSLWQLNRAPEAIAAIGQALRLYEQAETQLGLFDRQGQPPAALIYRGHIFAHFNQGRILASLGQHQVAAEAYEDALEIDTRYRGELNLLDEETIAQIYLNQSAAYLQSNQPEKAFLAAQQVTNRNSNSFAGWSNQGLAALNAENFAAARDAFENADRLSPNNVAVLTGLSRAYRGLRQQPQAIALIEQALNLDPNYQPAQQERNQLMANPKY